MEPPREVDITVSGRADVAWERQLWASGFRAVAGIDEVGRGAWAGPVVAAAVILSPETRAWGSLLGRVNDSKRLSPHQRESLIGDIIAGSLSIGIGFSGADEVDHLGIVAATRAAMMRAVAALSPSPDFLLLDFLTLPRLPQPQRGLPHGDAVSLSIAAASIVAKVTRDRWMIEREAEFAGYGFAQHKGYGTAAHRDAVERFGPCVLHRRSYHPIQAIESTRRSRGDSSNP
jgi:ribonuclease HII